jgi:hypothetical protein
MPKVTLLQLPNGCTCSPLIIQPKDWKRTINKPWAICYRFHEPGYPSKLVAVKGMNHIDDYKLRKEFTLHMMEVHLVQLKKGYNPRIGKVIEPRDMDISPYHSFLSALQFASTKLNGVPNYLNDVKSCIKKIGENAGYHSDLCISEIRTKHLESILEECRKTNPRFSAYRHNRYRSYLIKLFKKLRKLEVVDTNPAIEIDRLKCIKKKRRTTTRSERQLINEHLKKRDYYFWRFVQIFFHSGSRETELMRLRESDVKLESQSFICLVKKGSEYREIEGVIKDNILYLWKEVIAECKPGQYLFSKGLRPGDHPIRADQVGRRWRNMIKRPPREKHARWGGLGINCDLYSLKHSHTSQVVATLNEEDAARINKHTSTAMVVKIYDTEHTDRQAERLKRLDNEFC